MEWKIIDKVEGLPGMKKIQLWHHDAHQLNLAAFVNENEKAKQVECKSYNSTYYGGKEKGNATGFVFDSAIETTLRII